MLSPSQDLNLPPRKLLSRRSPMTEIPPLHLPLSDSDDDLDPYSTDEFRMYEFKIRRCTRSRSHDWTDCPFAHPGEKARRRDPRRCHYSGTPCAEFRRGACPRGESCEFAHGVFECWLHPARYRTNACKDGKSCKRKVCFFAHTPRQLRVLPAGGGSNHGAGNGMETPHSPSCHCCGGCYSSLESSPTSTLPPISSKNLFSRLNEVSMKERYEKALMELVSSLEKMGVTAGPVYGNGRPKPKDVFDGGDGFGGPDLKWVDELVM